MSLLGKHTCARIGAVCAYTCPFLACASSLHVAGCRGDIQHACQAPWGARWPLAPSPSPTRVGAWEVWGAYPSTLEGKGASACGGCRSEKGAPSFPPLLQSPPNLLPSARSHEEHEQGKLRAWEGKERKRRRRKRRKRGRTAAEPCAPGDTGDVPGAGGSGERGENPRGAGPPYLGAGPGSGRFSQPGGGASLQRLRSSPLLSSPLPPRRRRRLLAEGRPRPAPARPAPPPGPSASPPGRAGRCGAVRGRNGLPGRLVNPLLRTGRPGQGDRGCVGSAAAWSTPAPAGLPRPASRWCLQIPKEEIPQPPMAAWCLGIHALPRCLNCPLLQVGAS